MIDIAFQVNKVLTEMRTLRDLIKFYGEDDKEKMLNIVDDAETEIAKMKAMLWDENDI